MMSANTAIVAVHIADLEFNLNIAVFYLCGAFYIELIIIQNLGKD